jgi:hypothetical protein
MPLVVCCCHLLYVATTCCTSLPLVVRRRHLSSVSCRQSTTLTHANDNVADMRLECNKENHSMHIYFIDYSKAFDSVKHWVMKRIFDKLNLGPLSNVLMTLLKRSTTNLKVNKEILKEIINIEQGTKQDGISLLLFLLFMSPLLWKMEKDMKGIECNGLTLKIVAIMDDVAIATDNLIEAAYIIETLKKYSAATGIQMNPKKSAYAHKTLSSTKYHFLLSTPTSQFNSRKKNNSRFHYSRLRWVHTNNRWSHTHVASIAWQDGRAVGWPIHGPASSTEAEIQGLNMIAALHPFV